MSNGLSRQGAAILICVLFALGAFAVSGCGNDDGLESHPTQGEENRKAEEANFSDEPVPFQVLTGSTSGNHVKEPTAVIARNDADLNALKKKQFSNGVKRSSLAPVTFPESQVVAVFLPKAELGTSVTVTDVYEKDGQVQVKAVKLLPGKNCITAAKGTVYPFNWVGTRMMEGTPNLIIATQKSPDC